MEGGATVRKPPPSREIEASSTFEPNGHEAFRRITTAKVSHTADHQALATKPHKTDPKRDMLASSALEYQDHRCSMSSARSLGLYDESDLRTLLRVIRR